VSSPPARSVAGTRQRYRPRVHILLATDADWIVDEVTAALGGPETSFTVCDEGRVVTEVVAERVPDVAVLDLQIGSMGGMAVTMDLRLDESSGALPHVRVLMLLDRVADVHLARRSGAEGWLIKPLDPLRLKRAVAAVSAGRTFTEGTATEGTATEGTAGIAPPTASVEAESSADSTEEEPATAR
jgi:DNA-binding response OmpR family regulator